MAKKSAGMLVYRMANGILEVFLVHPGGPFWAKKDLGAWSIPKGEYEDGENPLDAAKREVEEETGIKVNGKFEALSPVKQKSGKIVTAWAIEANIDPSTIKSNGFEMEWPPRSGKMKEFPEVDRAAWFTIGEAINKIVEGQIPLLKELESRLNG
jgi:predicted NUDIX family NTP pyrophosphohydrolase